VATDQQSINDAVAALAAAQTIVCIAHVLPDGDALGSALGFAHVARAAGKTVWVSYPEPHVMNDAFALLPGADDMTPLSSLPADPDVVCSFDCGSIRRLGELGPFLKSARVSIDVDHHVSNDRFGSINVIDPAAAATSVVVRELCAALGWSLTRDSAICLFAALMTDTGRFQYSSTTAEVFALASELASFDLPIADLSRRFFEESRFAYLQLMARVVQRAQLDQEAGIVWAIVRAHDMDEFGVDIGEVEGLIDVIRRAKEADVSFILKEDKGGIVRGSLRSLKERDVMAIAAQFGGGGHRLAAGFSITGEVDDVEARVLELIKSGVGGR
jgi:phosphoesterase RecJ-like protein